MKLQFLLVLALMGPVLARAVEINEIMYNPAGDDAGNEWVEIYNLERFDLANWTIGDLSSNDTLVAIKVTDSQFAIVVENPLLFADSNASVYFAGSTIGNGLGNSGDTIYFYNQNKTLVDFVAYNSTFANGNNKTLEKYNNSWHESIANGGTPGYENSVFLFSENNSDISVNVTANVTENSTINYTNLTNSTNSSQNNTANITNSANTTNSTNSSINHANSTQNETNAADACFTFIQINTSKQIYEDEAIKFRHIVNSSSDNFSIIYWVEDLFGAVVKNPYETRTLTEKSFTPHPSERDTVYIIKSVLKTDCANATAEKIVIFKTNETFEDIPVKETKNETKKEEVNEDKTKFSYNLLYYDENITQNVEARAVVEIISDGEPHQIKITGYIYRGAKKYSDIYEESFTIDRNDKKSTELLFLTGASPGEYKMKIRINKDSQKTDYEITMNVTVISDFANATENNGETMNKTSNNMSATKTNTTSPPVVYQSKQSKLNAVIPIAIITVLAGLSAVLVWKR